VNDKGTLTWNPNGTLGTLAIADSVSGTSDSQTCNYFYDDLGRLGGKSTGGYSADCSTTWQQLFTFDPFGNISKSGSASFQPTYSTSTNRYTSIPGVTVSYDNSGNLLTDNLNHYTWDGYGNPASVNSTNLIYDALGIMVEQQNGSAYMQILYSQAGKTAIMSGQTLTKAFVYLPGGGTAIYGSSGPIDYRHTDWLGSSRLTSTPARGVYSASAYAPYGEQYALYGSADPSFTGQNSDTTSTLYDFPFREDSPTQGRWISPDPAGLAAVDPKNPQTWNRYAYVMNNPLALIDPLGTCSQLSYQTNTWKDGTVTYSNGQVTFLYDGPCNNPCGPGLGYGYLGGAIVCGPPGNLGTIMSQLQSQMGGGSSSGAANSSPGKPKSPARQQCEQQAAQAYAQEKSDAGADALKTGAITFGVVEVGFATGGCAVGGGAGFLLGSAIAEFTGGLSSFGGAAVGCFTGAVDMALNGLGPSVTLGLIGGGIGYGVARDSATTRYGQRMQNCSTL
jgi:RHS repeat-associated protein